MESTEMLPKDGKETSDPSKVKMHFWLKAVLNVKGFSVFGSVTFWQDILVSAFVISR